MKMIFVMFHCNNEFVKFMTHGLHNYNIFTEEMFFVKHVDIHTLGNIGSQRCWISLSR